MLGLSLKSTLGFLGTVTVLNDDLVKLAMTAFVAPDISHPIQAKR
ncbi:MAG: hypothetical protein Q7T35_05390 [Nitrosomonas sp.]|nr:hypothetical protein [Nitrosomonas sp.]